MANQESFVDYQKNTQCTIIQKKKDVDYIIQIHQKYLYNFFVFFCLSSLYNI